jgi:hypothetical protein
VPKSWLIGAVTNFSGMTSISPCPNILLRTLLRKIREQYRMAGLLLELTPSTEMPYFRNRLKVPPVAKPGRNIGSRLKDHLGLGKNQHIALIYVGEFGVDEMRWEDLEKFRDCYRNLSPAGVAVKYHRSIKRFAYEERADHAIRLPRSGIIPPEPDQRHLIYLPRQTC